MSKSQRELLRRKHERANNGLDKAIEHLGGMRETYHSEGKAYDLYQKYIDIIIVQVTTAQDNLTAFRSKFL